MNAGRKHRCQQVISSRELKMREMGEIMVGKTDHYLPRGLQNILSQLINTEGI